MARIKIEAIIGNLDSDIRLALADAVNETVDGAEFDENELFAAFKHAVGRKCNTWERVPDRYVQDENGRALG